MMNFYYDSILGLQYTYLGDLFIIDVAAIPNNYSVEELLNVINQRGVMISPIETVGQITNFMI